MLRLEASPRLGGHQLGLLPMLLALLGMTWAEVQPLQLQEKQVPMPGGKEPLRVGRSRGALGSAEGFRGLLGARPQACTLGRLHDLKSHL